MKPTKKLEQEVKKVLDMHIENARKWAELFCNIPIYSTLVTNVADLQEPNQSIQIGDVEGAIFYLILVLEDREGQGEDDDLIGCLFLPNDKAKIEPLSEVNHQKEYPELQNFFGLEGTWEEVTRKIIEASKILRPIPKFSDLPM